MKLKAIAAIGFAINPNFKLLLIDKGDVLDDEQLAVLDGVIEAAGGQAIMTRVSRGDECSVIIENGEVAP